MFSIRVRARTCLLAGAALALALVPRTAGAWAIGSQLHEPGCHEPITAEALRTVRASLGTMPPITPTRDEAAAIDDVSFQPPKDFVRDLAAMTLVLGVRDNDLKGIDPLSSLDLIQVHGNPTTQEEHCIRGPNDDDAAGNQAALDACRTFIREQATAALDGLDAAGAVDPSARTSFEVYLSLAGSSHIPLPVFYIKMGAAMHALEDGFAHTYRSDDGMRVTVVTNWIDLVLNGSAYDEARDGPPHAAALDQCFHADPLIQRNYTNATQAAAELLAVAADPTRTRDEKIAQFDVVTAKWLAYQPACTFDNHWCDAPEAKVVQLSPLAGCSAGGGAAGGLAVLLVGVVVVLRPRRRRALAACGSLVLIGALGSPARADAPVPSPGTPGPAAPTPETAVLPGAAPVPAANAPKEPGRDVKTPTTAELTSIRQDKQLGSALGFTAALGGAIDRAAAVATVGVRYRVTERWIVGGDAAWNPWITTSPLKGRAGVAVACATLIRRFPMKYDRVNLRTSVHLGTSTLLFDVYGAPKYSTGLYFALAPLGIDYDLGKGVRLVIDPVEFAIPVPELGQLPLYYEQFRFMVGLQFGS